MLSVAQRLAQVRERIAGAARLAGRDPSEILLVGASKRKPAEAIREAYAAGLRDFGENYVQELGQKAEQLADLEDLRLHMIGHLQRNKVRHVTKIASVVQTVDSTRLAHELGQRAAAHPVPLARRFRPTGAESDSRLGVMVEVNVGGEDEKAGCPPDELGAVMDAVDAEPALRLLGLMTLPPHTEDPRGAVPYFEQLVRLRDRHGGAGRLPELSMGMTHDLEAAIATGATIVRVGTAIFGPRT